MASELPERLIDIGGSESTDPERDRDPDEDSREETEEYRRFVVFDIGADRYGVPVEVVRSVVEVDELTRVPRSGEAVEGVTDLRGDITAVIDPRVHFEAAPPAEAEQRVLVFDRAADRQGAGIRVDGVPVVESVPADRIFRRSTPDEGVDGRHLRHELVYAVVSTPIGEEEFERIALIDVEALIEASGPAPAGDAERSRP